MIATNNGSFPWRDSAAGRELLDERARHDNGALSSDGLREVEDRVIRYLVDAQLNTGIDLVTDGLLRGEDLARPLALQLTGVAPGGQIEGSAGQNRRYTTPVVEGEIAWPGPQLVEDYLFASDRGNRPIKIVLTGPSTLASVADDRVYGDPNALAMAFAIAINKELRSLQEAGAAFIQIDDPVILDRPQEFPLYSRIWEVLGRGISSTLCLHIEGGSIAPIYQGLMRLKRLGCLSFSVVGVPENLDLVRSTPLPEGLRVGLGVIDGRSAQVAPAADIIRVIDGGSGLPPGDRLLLGTATDLGSLASADAAAKLRELTHAVQKLNAP